MNGICFSFSSSSSRSAGLSQGGPLGSLASLKPTRLVKILRSAPRVMVPNISMGSPGDRGGVSLTGKAPCVVFVRTSTASRTRHVGSSVTSPSAITSLTRSLSIAGPTRSCSSMYGAPRILMCVSYMPRLYLSPTALAKNTVSMSGMMSCSDPVVSITRTVMLMVMRVAPPSEAAAPSTAYVCRSTGRCGSIAPTTAATARPTICPIAAPTARDGTNRPVGAPMPYVHVIKPYMRQKYSASASMPK